MVIMMLITSLRIGSKLISFTDMCLCLQPNLQNGPTSSRADGDSSSAFGTWTMYTVVALAVIAAGFMAYKRLHVNPRASRGPF